MHSIENGIVKRKSISHKERWEILKAFDFKCACCEEEDINLLEIDHIIPLAMGGSDERPVSTAKICSDNFPKHSSMESNPDFEPSIENQGVQI